MSISIENFNQIDHSIIYEDLVKGYHKGTRKKYFSSPLGTGAKKFSIFKGRGDGKLIWKDFKSNEHGDVIDLICKLNNKTRKSHLNEILNSLNDKYNLELKSDRDFKAVPQDYKVIDWTNEALEYWQQFKVTKNHLLSEQIFQIEDNSNIAFVFRYPKGLYKQYRPQNSKMKYKCSKSASFNDELQYLAEYESQVKEEGVRLPYLLLCEGCKDALIARSNGLYAIGVQSTNTLPSIDIIRRIKHISLYPIICFDNDQAGVNATQKFQDLYGGLNLDLDKKYNDFGNYFGSNQEANIIEDQISDLINSYKSEWGINIVEDSEGYISSGTSKNGQVYSKRISNFILKEHAMIVSDETSKKIVSFHSSNQATEPFSCNTDDFNSIGQLRKLCESKGDYYFNGSNLDLHSIKLLNSGNKLTCREIPFLGFEKQSKAFILSNGVIANGSFKPTNRFGIVDTFFIPAASIPNVEQSPYKEQAKIKYKPSSTNLNTFIDSFVQLYPQDTAILAISWFIANVYFDVIFRKKLFFPMLLVWGQRGSGKSSFGNLLYNLFGNPIQAINLVNATRTALNRSLAQFSNIPKWFNEFKISVKDDVKEFLKSTYDGEGRVMAQKDHTNKTRTLEIRSSCMITGEHFPTQNEALYSRLVIGQLPEIKKSTEMKEKFDRTIKLFNYGLGNVLISLLDKRSEIEEGLELVSHQVYDILNKRLASDGIDANTRLVNNYATIFTPILILGGSKLLDLKKLDYLDYDNLIEVVYRLIIQQFEAEEKLDDAIIFFEYFINMIEKQRVMLGTHFWIEGEDLYFRKEVLKEYSPFYFDYNKNLPPSASILIKYIEKKPYYNGRVKKRFNRFNQTGKSQVSVHKIDLRMLPEEIQAGFHNSVVN